MTNFVNFNQKRICPFQHTYTIEKMEPAPIVPIALTQIPPIVPAPIAPMEEIANVVISSIDEMAPIAQVIDTQAIEEAKKILQQVEDKKKELQKHYADLNEQSSSISKTIGKVKSYMLPTKSSSKKEK
jgi:hypothetical protein